MNQRTLLLLVLTVVLISIPARADLIQVQMELRSSQGALLYSGSAVVSDPAVEFQPLAKLSFDFTGGWDLNFRPLVNANFLAYDAIFTVTTPHAHFSGVSPLAPVTGKYSLASTR